MPKEVQIKCPYATYSTSYFYDDTKNQLVSVATLELLQHRIPADGYAGVKEFFDKVMSDATQKLVIKKN